MFSYNPTSRGAYLDERNTSPPSPSLAELGVCVCVFIYIYIHILVFAVNNIYEVYNVY